MTALLQYDCPPPHRWLETPCVSMRLCGCQKWKHATQMTLLACDVHYEMMSAMTERAVTAEIAGVGIPCRCYRLTFGKTHIVYPCIHHLHAMLDIQNLDIGKGAEQ